MYCALASHMVKSIRLPFKADRENQDFLDVPLLKQLQRHILSHVPNAKITFLMPNSDDKDESTKAKKPTPNPDTSLSHKQARQHDRDRTANWRAEQEVRSATTKSS